MSWVFALGPSGQAPSSQSEAPSACFCWHLHRRPHDRTLHPYLASMPFKGKPLARGTRVHRGSSIAGWFCGDQGSIPFEGSAAAFDLALGAHCRRRWPCTRRGRGSETTGEAIVWCAGLEPTVDQSAFAPYWSMGCRNGLSSERDESPIYPPP